MRQLPAAPRRTGRIAALLTAATLTLTTACSTAAPGGGSQVPTAASPTAAGPSAGGTVAPDGAALQVQVLSRGLSHGWDIGFLPDGNLLVSERGGRFMVVDPRQPADVATAARPVEGDLSDVYARGEGGLLGFVLHPDFATSGLLTACLNHAEGGAAVDVRLVTYRLTGSATSRRVGKVRDLLTGLPTASSGRHSGCRPTIAADGALIVGTGDTATGALPQDRTSLGGKTLRLDLTTGRPAAGNPFESATSDNERYVYTYGHRNVQGVAVQPGTGAIYTVEHGPDRDDEVNLLKAGGNYGWDPSRGGTRGGYDESVPMTDLTRFPQAVPAVWSSGAPTLATSGAAFVAGSQWGPYDGALAVTALKDSKLLFMRLGSDGTVASVAVPKELDGTYGRLRAIRVGPDQALYVASSNGDGDVLLRITRKQ